MSIQQKFLENLGAKIEYAGEGKIFTTWNGNDVRIKKYKYIISIFGAKYIAKSINGFILSMIKDGQINESNINENGHCLCPRCSGKGVMDHYKYYDGGWCFKCNGEGILWKIKNQLL